VQGINGLSSALKNARKRAADSDDELSVFMSSLSGSQLSDADFAETGQQVNLINSTSSDDPDDQLPLTYDPEAIADYWGIRPVSVVSRVLQLGTISSNFIAGLVWDWATGQLKNNEVRRAIQIRQIVTSLGPAYIKLGQALSIRPDLLSPPAMKEMQKLCDKVCSRFPVYRCTSYLCLQNCNQMHTYR
jgi:aarF domain-containing kinase